MVTDLSVLIRVSALIHVYAVPGLLVPMVTDLCCYLYCLYAVPGWLVPLVTAAAVLLAVLVLSTLMLFLYVRR